MIPSYDPLYVKGFSAPSTNFIVSKTCWFLTVYNLSYIYSVLDFIFYITFFSHPSPSTKLYVISITKRFDLKINHVCLNLSDDNKFLCGFNKVRYELGKFKHFDRWFISVNSYIILNKWVNYF